MTSDRQTGNTSSRISCDVTWAEKGLKGILAHAYTILLVCLCINFKQLNTNTLQKLQLTSPPSVAHEASPEFKKSLPGTS